MAVPTCICCQYPLLQGAAIDSLRQVKVLLEMSLQIGHVHGLADECNGTGPAAVGPSIRSTLIFTLPRCPIAVCLEHFLHMAHNTNPADFGWSYQGSNAQSRVEFRQHPTTGAKLDYYPTSASIKYSGREGC